MQSKPAIYIYIYIYIYNTKPTYKNTLYVNQTIKQSSLPKAFWAKPNSDPNY